MRQKCGYSTKYISRQYTEIKAIKEEEAEEIHLYSTAEILQLCACCI